MDDAIRIKLIMHYGAVAEKYDSDNLIGVFLYGSQNYNVSTDNSDVDSIALVMPNFEQLVLGTPKNEEIDMMPDFGIEGHCVVKDIRNYAKELRNGSPNALEVLFTEHFILNPIHEELWYNTFIDSRTSFMSYQSTNTIKAMAGNALRNLKKNTGKGQAAAYRLGCSIEKYRKMIYDYQEIINVDNKELFLAIKEDNAVNPYQENFFENILKNNNLSKRDEEDEDYQEFVNKNLNNAVLNFIRRNLFLEETQRVVNYDRE
jgi:hypothetical protein